MVGTHQLVRLAHSPTGSCSRLKYDLEVALTSLWFRPLEAIPPFLFQLARACFVVWAVWMGRGRPDGFGRWAGMKDNLQRLGKVLGESRPCLVFSLVPPPSDSHSRYSSRVPDLSQPRYDQPSFHLTPLFMFMLPPNLWV